MATANMRVDTVEWFGTKSHTKRQIDLTILGTSEKLSLPVEVTTKVYEVKFMLGQRLGVEPETLTFVVKQASSHKKLTDFEEVRSCSVRGVRSWEREKAKYPHPICIIGAGHQGLRQALSFLKEGITDFCVYDRLDKVGGLAWVKNANPTSKLQTELGVYHLQYDKDYQTPRKKMKTWPTRDELLQHFHDCCEEFGIMAHVQLNMEITEVKAIVNDKDKPMYDVAKQHLDLKMQRTDIADPPEVERTFSAVANYPGALVQNLRIEYPGEDLFEGSIGYGMFEEFDYKLVAGGTPAIMGMGAFGVENVRTCLEHGANKVFLICRRKNISMPRVISWFINQSLYPPMAAMCLDALRPMYDLIPADPWSFYAVIANKDQTVATLRQKSRFGIGDVYFLAHYYKRVEVVVDSIKRLSGNEIVMESGDRLRADHLIKVLGFRADETVDKLMGVKEMVGFFVNGDWRRWIVTESPGVDAGKFGGTSLSPGVIQHVEFYSYFVNYPRDVAGLLDSQMLPRRKPDKEKGQPAYVWDMRTGSSISMIISGGLVPALAEIGAGYGPLNRAKMLEAHPVEQFIGEVAAEWLDYCKMLQDPDDHRPYPPYPYTVEYVKELCTRNDVEGEQDALRQAARMAG